MSNMEPLALQYFNGGVPTGYSFRMILEDIHKISKDNSNLAGGIDRIQEICFVGVMSYFEAFCKEHFASLINIEPSLVERLKTSGQDVAIDGATIALYGMKINYRLGFLISEKYDFGSASKINTLYSALLKITPFSKNETRTYSELLRDRNLLVHHGGIYTMSHLANHPEFQKYDLKEHAFINSCVITKDQVISAIGFLNSIAKKMTRSAHSALTQYINSAGLLYSDERKKALQFIRMWVDEEEAELSGQK